MKKEFSYLSLQMGCFKLDILENLEPKLMAISKNSTFKKVRIVDFLTTKKGVEDYYPFGMLVPNRNGGGNYRYSFNGKEKDDEVKGSSNSYDFGARIYDNRLGRFLSLDPLESHYPFMSPFCFAANTPIQAIDENGEGPIVVVQSKVRSTVVKALIKKYQAGEIEFNDLHKSVKSIMGQVYKQGKDIDWLNRKYKEGGLGKPRAMKEVHLNDKNFDVNAQPMPYVAYKQDEIADDNLYLTLTEEREDGTWEEKKYVIQAPERTFTNVPVTNSNKTQPIFTEINVVKGAGFILNIIGDFNPVTAAVKGIATLATGENFTGGKASNTDKGLAGASVILPGASIYLGTATNVGKVVNTANNASTIGSIGKTTVEAVIEVKESL